MSSLFSGWSARQNAKRNASIMEEETRAAAIEKSRDLQKLQAQQRLSFAKSGVTTDGSPLLVMDETKRQGLAEIDDLLRTNFRKAAAVRTAGRQAFVAGILKASEDVGMAIASGGMSEGSKGYNSRTGSAGASKSSYSNGNIVTWNS